MRTSTKTSEGSYPINVVSFHDVHYGHDSTTTAEVVNSMQIAFPDTDPFIKELDYLFYPGDVFDRLLHLPNHGVPLIRAEFRRQFHLAERYGFIPMILEGTPSHDWKQSNMIRSVVEEMGYTGEYYYIDHLAVITTSKGHTFLFVPDEWRANNEKTYLEALEAISAAGLKQVDFILFHGQFDYQIKELSLTLPCHDSEKWQKLARHYIFAGHIHKPSQHGKILVAGSFERLRHREEHPKGHLRVTVTGDGNDVITFVENKLAKTYNTYDVRGMEPHDIYKFAVEKAMGLRMGSFLRLWGTRSQGLKGLVKSLEKDYGQYRWSIKLEKSPNDVAPVAPEAVEEDGPRESKRLTRDVMLEEILERLPKRGLPDNVIEKAIAVARSTLC